MEKNYNQQDEMKYFKGYNRGTLFAEFDRELLNELASINSNDPYLVGVRQGKDDFDRERKQLENLKQPEWLQEGRLTNMFNKERSDAAKEKNLDKDRDKDRER